MNVGDIYWINSIEVIPHPYVIIKIDKDNLTICALTTNKNKAAMPGVVVLNSGEGNLKKESIVEVYKQQTISKSELKQYIGTLSKERVEQILNGVGFINRSFFNKEDF